MPTYEQVGTVLKALKAQVISCAEAVMAEAWSMTLLGSVSM